MKQYINPPTDVLNGRVGRKLTDSGEIPRRFQPYKAQLRSGEHLYAGLTGGFTPPQFVAWAGNEAEFNRLYNLYFSGAFTGIDFYALPDEVAAD